MYVPANTLQYTGASVPAAAAPAITYLTLAPPQGDATPQTHATASLTG